MIRRALLAIALVAPGLASAFGVEGHEAVCEVAYRELRLAAKAAVDEILSVEEDPQLRTLRQACVWPDHDGKVQRARRGDHYINVPRYWSSIWNEDCHGASSCTFVAISKDLNTLDRRHATPKERLVALKFLGHWLGDIHQPLHVSYADDSRRQRAADIHQSRL